MVISSNIYNSYFWNVFYVQNLESGSWDKLIKSFDLSNIHKRIIKLEGRWPGSWCKTHILQYLRHYSIPIGNYHMPYMLAFNKEEKILFLAIPPSNCTKPPHLSTKNGQDLCSSQPMIKLSWSFFSFAYKQMHHICLQS